jgi:hypothetical protein
MSAALLLDYKLTHASILTSLAHSHFKLYLSAVRDEAIFTHAAEDANSE